VVNNAKTSARRLWGEDSLEPDYAILQNKHVSSYHAADSLQRVAEKGDSGRILEILPGANPSHKEELSRTVINRPELPVEAAKKALGGNDAGTVRLAAQIAGRVGPKAGDAEKALEAAIDKWAKAWEEKRTKLTRVEDEDEYEDEDEGTDRITACLQKLLWAAGRLGVAQNALIRAATTRQDDSAYRPVRLEAVTALAAGPVPDAVADVLEKAAQGNDPEIRTIAAEALGRKKADRASKLAEKVLSDRTSFNRIAMQPNVHVTQTLHKHAGQVHYQGVVLPQLIARNDLRYLSEVADNRTLPEVARLGAIEGLAMLATEAAEGKLLEIGQNKDEEEELRKAAWRGLKRSRRARKAKQTV
jgi:ParB family chromosome partitioning protein